MLRLLRQESQYVSGRKQRNGQNFFADEKAVDLYLNALYIREIRLSVGVGPESKSANLADPNAILIGEEGAVTSEAAQESIHLLRYETVPNRFVQFFIDERGLRSLIGDSAAVDGGIKYPY
jgi:hypothetical protein